MANLKNRTPVVYGVVDDSEKMADLFNRVPKAALFDVACYALSLKHEESADTAIRDSAWLSAAIIEEANLLGWKLKA